MQNLNSKTLNDIQSSELFFYIFLFFENFLIIFWESQNRRNTRFSILLILIIGNFYLSNCTYKNYLANYTILSCSNIFLILFLKIFWIHQNSSTPKSNLINILQVSLIFFPLLTTYFYFFSLTRTSTVLSCSLKI